jgi:hypothetical protein
MMARTPCASSFRRSKGIICSGGFQLTRVFLSIQTVRDVMLAGQDRVEPRAYKRRNMMVAGESSIADPCVKMSCGKVRYAPPFTSGPRIIHRNLRALTLEEGPGREAIGIES